MYRTLNKTKWAVISKIKGEDDTNMLSSSWDELGLSIGKWERPPLLIKTKQLPEGFSALWSETINGLALTTCFPGLDALVVKHMSTPRHVPRTVLFIVNTFQF